MKPFRHFAYGAFLLPALLPLAACSTVGPALDTRLATTAPARAAQPPRQTRLPSGRDQVNAIPKVGRPYEVRGQWYTPAEQPDYDETGTASWYGEAFQGKPTADGEVFDMNVVSAAHKTLPLPSMVEVTNLDNGRSLVLRVNDRGPFVDGRIIDLSKGAADELGVLRPGLARVRVRYVGPAPAVTDTQIAEALGAPRRPRTPAPASPPPAVSETQFAEGRAAPRAPAKVELASLPPVSLPPVVIPPPIQPEFEDVRLADEPVEKPILAEVAKVSPAPLPAAPAPMPIALPSAGWVVQAGAWPELGGAEQAARRLTVAGAPQIRLIRQGGDIVYQVIIAAPDQAAATALQSQIVARGFSGAQILRP